MHHVPDADPFAPAAAPDGRQHQVQAGVGRGRPDDREQVQSSLSPGRAQVGDRDLPACGVGHREEGRAADRAEGDVEDVDGDMVARLAQLGDDDADKPARMVAGRDTEQCLVPSWVVQRAAEAHRSPNRAPSPSQSTKARTPASRATITAPPNRASEIR